MKFEIRYYLNEGAYNLGIPSFSEVIDSDRMYAVNWAESRINSTEYKYYDIKEI